MSITSYSELQTAAANWLARDDLTSRIVEFVALSESEFNRKIRVRQMMVTSASSPSSGQFDLPTDYLAWRNVRWQGDTFNDLQYADPEIFANLYPSAPAGTPKIFTVIGTTDQVGVVKITPSSTTVINFTYYQKITALSTDTTANWLLTAHPDVYLAGTLTEGYAYTKDYDQAAVWKARRDGLIGDINSLDQKTRGPAGIRPLGPTP